MFVCPENVTNPGVIVDFFFAGLEYFEIVYFWKKVVFIIYFYVLYFIYISDKLTLKRDSELYFEPGNQQKLKSCYVYNLSLNEDCRNLLRA